MKIILTRRTLEARVKRGLIFLKSKKKNNYIKKFILSKLKKLLTNIKTILNKGCIIKWSKVDK